MPDTEYSLSKQSVFIALNRLPVPVRTSESWHRFKIIERPTLPERGGFYVL